MSDLMELRFFERLAKAVGATAALRICAYWGRRKLYVPSKIASDHLIAKVIGLEAAQGLVSAFPEQLLSIPACELTSLRRAAHVAMLWKYGVPVTASANILGVSAQRIKQLRGELQLEGYDADALLPMTHAAALGMPDAGADAQGGEHEA